MSEKNNEVLEAHIKIIDKEPKTFQHFGVLKNLAQENEEIAKSKEEKLNLNDNDQRLFFGNEFIDGADEKQDVKKSEWDEKLIDYDGFDEFMSASSNILLPSQLLMDDNFYNMPTNIDLLSSLVPSQNNNESSSSLLLTTTKEEEEGENSLSKNPSKKANDISKWFQLFSELDPLNQQKEVQDSFENMHAA